MELTIRAAHQPTVHVKPANGSPLESRAMHALDLATRERGPHPSGLRAPKQHQARAGFSVIGRPPNRLRNNVVHSAYWMQANNYLMVPPESIERAKAQIPMQDDAWSCGPNSAARAIVASGNGIFDYNTGFRDTFTTHFEWVPFSNGKTGPSPGELHGNLRSRRREFRTTFVPRLHLRCEEFPKETMDEIWYHLHRQRPLVALMSFGSMNQHYVVIVGEAPNGAIAYLNTDGEIYELPRDEFLHQMDCNDTWLKDIRRCNNYNLIAFERHDQGEPGSLTRLGRYKQENGEP